MKKLLTFVVSLLLLLLIAFLIISQINNSKPFFFIQMSDPQFGFLDANESIEKETILYERAVADINRLNPDFVVERFAGEVPPRFLAGPGWGLIRNDQILNKFEKRLEEKE